MRRISQNSAKIAILVALLCTLAGAGEFVVYQGNRTFSSSDNGFHYYYRINNPFPAAWPQNWRSPIDYNGGRWYWRVALASSPQDLPISFQTCIWMHDADGTSSTSDEFESCDSRKMTLDEPKVYSTVTDPLDQWWHKNGGANAIDISRPDDFKRMGLVLRTAGGCYVSPYNVQPNCWDQRDDYYPMDMHLSIVAVSAGATFSGWNNYVSVPGQQAPADIAAHPTAVTVAAGQPASFSVQTTGAAPLTYQWKVTRTNGATSNVNGANQPTFTIASAAEATSGFRFHCVVTNAYGMGTSVPATLTVTPGTGVDPDAASPIPRSMLGNGQVRVSLAAPGRVEVSLHAPSGRLVRRTLDGALTAGQHVLAIDLGDIPAGIYIARIRTGATTKCNPLLVR